MSHADMRHEPLRERLRERRWRITPQRRSVVEALSGPNLHLTADEIFARARAVVPEISRATVYNSLRELVEMGELAEMQIGPGPVLYDPNAVVHHHHLACSNCGRIYDIHPLGVEHLGLRKEDRDGFDLQRVEVVFHGRCRACEEGEDT